VSAPRGRRKCRSTKRHWEHSSRALDALEAIQDAGPQAPGCGQQARMYTPTAVIYCPTGCGGFVLTSSLGKPKGRGKSSRDPARVTRKR
jgi:hypothetical protein